MKDQAQDTAGVIAPPPFIYLGPLLLGLALHRILPLATLPRELARRLGWALIAVGIVGELWFVVTMWRAQTPMNPWKPSTALVTWGPFRYSRNPSYLSMTALYVGIASLVNTLWPLLFLPGVLWAMQRGVVEREERYLERKFGDEYRRYRGRVRRWV